MDHTLRGAAFATIVHDAAVGNASETGPRRWVGDIVPADTIRHRRSGGA
jgi:hypothetical protein